MGGAMDLVSGANMVIVTMEHTARGNHKIFDECTLPLTGKGVVDMLVTEMAVFKFDNPNHEITLTEIADGYSVEDVKAATGTDFLVADDLKPFQI